MIYRLPSNRLGGGGNGKSISDAYGETSEKAIIF